MNEPLDRRSFVKRAGVWSAAGLGLPGAKLSPAGPVDTAFQSAWPPTSESPWPGPDFWPNPLGDWRISAGRLECHSPGGDRNVVLLTRSVSPRAGTLFIKVRCGPLQSGSPQTPRQGFVGFRLGIKHQANDYRAAAIYGQGMNAGVSADGRLFIGSLEATAPAIDLAAELSLELEAAPSPSGYMLILRASNYAVSRPLEIKRDVPSDWLTGSLALVCSSAPVYPTPIPLKPIKDFSFYPPHQERGGTMRFWFADWRVAGTKVEAHPECSFGPILFTLYTLSRGVLKLSAQFPPLGNAPKTVTFQIRAGTAWRPIATADLDEDAWNVTFRVPCWDASQDHLYRVLYQMPGAHGALDHYSYEGTIRKDPVEKPEIVVGLLTCIWDFGFPHTDFVQHLGAHQPDLLLWTGDQIYEPVAGFGVIQSRAPEMITPAMHDFLRKWFVFGWAVRELTRAIPSVCLTDDHDMYHGNIWGCGGRPTNPAAGSSVSDNQTVRYRNYAEQDSGGYKMAPRWVNMVQRAQTAHLPDPFDPTPVRQGITTYYTDLLWGGVSFALLEDRKWKSAPKPTLPAARIVNGFAQNPEWNAATQSNAPDAELLGQRQLDFLEFWAANWSGGAWLKFVVSQTIFGCLHTEPAGVNVDDHDPEEAIPPVGTYLAGDHLVADHDSGAWPQHGRDAAIRKWRKGFATHLCGDQHLGTISHYGVDLFRDGVYSVCTPAISNIWPRRWYPPQPAPNALPGQPGTGDHLDAFGNRVSVFAAANPAQYPGPGLDGLRLRATGYTILTCRRSTRETIVASWPRWLDPTAPGAEPYPGWPVTIQQLDNGLRGAAFELPPIETAFRDPVVQVQKPSGEVVYTLRVQGDSVTLPVREAGRYHLIAYDPDGDFYRQWQDLEARPRR